MLMEAAGVLVHYRMMWPMLLGIMMLNSKGINSQGFELEPTDGPPKQEDSSSCVARCDEQYYPGLVCYCNEACDQYENCCFDYYSECRPDFVWSDDWLSYNGHKYKYFSDSTVTGERAFDECKDIGALLVSINDLDEADFIDQLVLKKRTLSAFIGGGDIQQEGIWQWLDGSRMPLPTDAWQAWYQGQPDNAGGQEHCAALTNFKFWEVLKFMIDHYVWIDYSCTVSTANEIQGYICEATELCEPNPCQNSGLCSYVGNSMGDGEEFTCTCVGNYVGDRCELEMKEGELWTQCGETNLTSQRGEVTSPLYPKAYPNNVRCEWKITSQPGSTVAIRFESFDIEVGKDCAFDGVMIYDGGNRNTSTSLTSWPLCGNNLSSIPTNYISSTNEMLVTFTSDHSQRFAGFKLLYKEERCGMGVGDSGCGTRRTFTSECGAIDVTSGPNNAECGWLIDVPPGHVVTLHFTHFVIQDSGMSCSDGQLSVYDGANEDSPLVGEYCGERFPWSITSSGSQLFLQLSEVTWEDDNHRISAEYIMQASADYSFVSPSHVLYGSLGAFTSRQTPVNVRTSNTTVQQWLVRVPIGERLELVWKATLQDDGATLTVFNGYSNESGILLQASGSAPGEQSGSTMCSGFQALVILEKQMDDAVSFTEIQYTAKEWLPRVSGCYRPYYYSAPGMHGVENNMVTEREPVMIMVSDKAYATVDAGYEQGLYCKWLIQGSAGHTLDVDLLDINIIPVSENCDYDGLILYEGNTTTGRQHGPFCGSKEYLQSTITSGTSDLLVVFYSDPRGGRRQGGIARMLVADKGPTSCPIHHMDSVMTNNLVSDCGILLSPGFPGLVSPGIYSWTIQGPDWGYYDIDLHYVRGPGIKDDCTQFFEILEIAHSTGKIRQGYATLVYLCGSTELFVPNTTIQSPPHQKFAVELNLAAYSIPQFWQFKLTYKVKYMEQPKSTTAPDGVSCPDEYVYYHGNCYRYYPWVMRHYYEEYAFQTKWQSSLEYCEAENATFVSIYDEDEAYFLKYMMAHEWFWNPSGTFQSGHRFIYIGLNDKRGHYEWTDGSKLSYADWFTPRAVWSQGLFVHDTVVTELVNLDLPQPSADGGSLCASMILVSPHVSTNWVKIPCDYPMFDAGLICKRKALGYQDFIGEAVSPSDAVREPQKVCPSDYLMMSGRCIQLLTNYDLVRSAVTASSSQQSPAALSYSAASALCEEHGGIVAHIDEQDMDKLNRYLKLWRHEDINGDVWIGKGDSDDECKILKVSRNEEDVISYAEKEAPCISEEGKAIRSVICETEAKDIDERCLAHEFECDNEMCIGVDSVCDGAIDCPDGSDEFNCTCGMNTFECHNGICIPINLYCDFVDHCGDNSDESACVLNMCNAGEFHCDNGQCIDVNKKCDFQKDCTDGSDENPSLCETECSGITCFSGACIPASLEKDLVSDCPGLSLEDEVDATLDLINLFDVFKEDTDGLNSTVTIGCHDVTSVPCRQGHPRCFARSQSCIYDTDMVDEGKGLQVQTGCRDGAHARNYCGDVECPGMYHCPGSFCLPFRKLCDASQDCPGGEDELNCGNYTCPGMFKCKGEGFCIPHSEVCDGKVQCRMHREDEKYCSNKEPLCSIGCSCSGHSVFCEDAFLTYLPNGTDEARTPRALFLSNNQITLDAASFKSFHWLAKLILSNNKMKSVQSFVFQDLKNLLSLDLSNNLLSVLLPSTFNGLISLQTLDLSGNQLIDLTKIALDKLINLRHLIIEDNPYLDSVEQDTFHGLTSLNILNTDAFKFCCIAQDVETCTPAGDAFSNCKDLMANYPLQISIWVLGMSAVCGNLFVIVWRIAKDRSRVSSFFITNLGVSDFLMGVYMLIIGSVDAFYRGRYIIYADSWRASAMCQIAGFLAMLSSELSVFMLTAITLDRAAAIIFPLQAKQFRMKHARFVAITGWLVCIVLSLLPATGLPYFGDAFFGRTGVCLPFQVTNEKLPGWEYSIFIFLIVNLLSFVVIFIAYILIFMTVKSSIKSMGGSSTGDTDELTLAKKLALVVATDFLCWVPIILIGFAALGGAQIDPQVSAWIAVFILPLNSAINPILYTVSTIDCKKRKKKRNPTLSNTTKTTSVATTKTIKAMDVSQSTKEAINGTENGAFDHI